MITWRRLFSNVVKPGGVKLLMNVIVLVTDSLRKDQLGCYGSSTKTPNIDSLARAGVILHNVYSENLPTMPMRRGWWTGEYHFHEAGWQPFPEEDKLLAEVLWDKGFTSALVTDTYHMHKPGYNCSRGFDSTFFIRGQEYDPWLVDADPAYKIESSPIHRLRPSHSQNKLWRQRFQQYLQNCSYRKSEEDYFAPRVMKQAINWLDRVTKKKKDKLFLWVDMFDPHEPWDPPQQYRKMYRDPDYNGPDLVDPVPGAVEGYMTEAELENTINLYRAEVTFVDKWIGYLLEKIKDLGIDDNTLIIHTSDHGEPFGEHGYIRKCRPNNYQYLVNIPWIIRPPQPLAENEINSMVQSIDMMPTILDFLNIDVDLWQREGRTEENSEWNNPLAGQSLLPVLRGKRENIRDYVCGGHYGQQWYIKNQEWSYLLPLTSDHTPELYRLQEDPEEQNNLVDKHPEIGEHLELKLRRFAAEINDK